MLNSVIAVTDLSDASHKWNQIRDAKGWDMHEAPIALVVNTDTGEQVAKVSYNGRVWGTDGAEIRIGNRKTAAERESEGWQ